MNLSEIEQSTIRNYINTVDKVVLKFVPNPVPGNHLYNLMMNYQLVRNKVINILIPSSEDETKSKYKQIDLEEAIKQQKKENASKL